MSSAIKKTPFSGSVLSIIHSQDIGTYTLAYGNPKQYGVYWRPDSVSYFIIYIEWLCLCNSVLFYFLILEH